MGEVSSNVLVLVLPHNPNLTGPWVLFWILDEKFLKSHLLSNISFCVIFINASNWL